MLSFLGDSLGKGRHTSRFWQGAVCTLSESPSSIPSFQTFDEGELRLPFKHYFFLNRKIQERNECDSSEGNGRSCLSSLEERVPKHCRFPEYWDALGMQSYRDALTQALCFLSQHSLSFPITQLPPSPASALSTHTAVNRE